MHGVDDTSIEHLEKEMRECERLIDAKTAIPDNSFDAEKQITALAEKMKQTQSILKKKYKEIFPEAANAPEEFWEAFMSL